MHTLTKASQVLDVVAAGGKIGQGEREGLLRLTDSAGIEVQAWQTALKTASKKLPAKAGEVSRHG